MSKSKSDELAPELPSYTPLTDEQINAIQARLDHASSMPTPGGVLVMLGDLERMMDDRGYWKAQAEHKKQARLWDEIFMFHLPLDGATLESDGANVYFTGQYGNFRRLIAPDNTLYPDFRWMLRQAYNRMRGIMPSDKGDEG